MKTEPLRAREATVKYYIYSAFFLEDVDSIPLIFKSDEDCIEFFEDNDHPCIVYRIGWFDPIFHDVVPDKHLPILIQSSHKHVFCTDKE